MKAKKIKIAIFGLGTVGGGTLQLLQKNSSLIEEKTGYAIEVVKAVVRSPEKKRNLNLDRIALSKEADFVLQDENIDLIFEATGDRALALKIIHTAFAKNKKVITANKALLAEKWLDIAKELSNPNFIRFEAAVAGAIPIIDVLQNGLSANQFSSVYGIMNGTCNFILSRMERGDVDFQTALQEAQELGYAEADPSLDVGGIDAAHKLIIMMNLIYRSIFDFSKLYIEGIDKLEPSSFHYAKKMGYKIKLLCITKKVDTQIQASVHPVLIPQKHLLASVEGADNAIFLESDFAGNSMLQGAGAGAKPTASAMVSDLIQMLQKTYQIDTQKYFPNAFFIEIEKTSFEYFLEFTVSDEVGVLESISSLFSGHSISIRSILQDDKNSSLKNSVHLVILTHLIQEKNMLSAISLLKKEKFVIKNPNFIRVLPSQKQTK